MYTNLKKVTGVPRTDREKQSKGVKKADYILSRTHHSMKRKTHLDFLKSSWESPEAIFHYLEQGIRRYTCLTHSIPMYKISYDATCDYHSEQTAFNAHMNEK